MMHLPQLLDLPDEPRLSDRDFGAITEGSATATTRDAGMQWVGRVPGLYNSDGFKPTYCCTSAGSFNIPETPTIQGFDVFEEFAARAREGMYDEINPLHGYSGVHREENSGTIIPVTPPFTDVDGATRLVGLAARHCVEDDDGTYYARLSCTNERSNVKATHVPPSDRLACVPLDAELPPAVTADPNLQVPSSPNRALNTGTSRADLAVLLATVRPNQTTPSSFFYVPHAEQPEEGVPILIAGYAGPVEKEWVRRYVIKPSEMQPGSAPGRVAFLDDATARSRTKLFEDNVVHPYCLALSVGTVYRTNNKVVEHTASVCPGFSGSPGSLVRDHRKLVFMHIMSQMNHARPVSYGLSVLHPIFAATYMKLVLPRLCQCAALGRDQLEAIWQYVERFAVQWEELGVSNEVQEFADQFHFQFQ